MAGLTIAYVTKDDDEVKDWTFDYSKELAAGDLIIASTWTAPAGLTVVTSTFTTLSATVWLSGGTIGQKYIVVNTIHTASTPSRIEERALEVLITESGAVAVDHNCTLDDVNKLIPQVPFTETSKPNMAIVIGFISAIAREMDAMLANVGYIVPISSGANALESARETCAWGVLGLAQTVRDTGVTTAVSTYGKPTVTLWTQLYRDRMKALTNPQDPYEWTDAPRTNEQLQKQPENVLRSFVQSLPSLDSSFDPDQPTVTRDQVL